jgi:hypothetical protein
MNLFTIMPTNSPEYYEKNKHKYFVWPKANKKSMYRKRARRIMEKKWLVKPNDWKEVDHKDGNVKNNSPSNLRVVSKYKNRYDGAKKRNGKAISKPKKW